MVSDPSQDPIGHTIGKALRGRVAHRREEGQSGRRMLRVAARHYSWGALELGGEEEDEGAVRRVCKGVFAMPSLCFIAIVNHGEVASVVPTIPLPRVMRARFPA